MIQITVEGRRASVSNKEILTSGSIGIECQWTFSEDWAGLTKTAVFRFGEDGDGKEIVLTSTNRCVVPWEVLTEEGEPVFAGVYGINDETGTIVVPTVWASIGVVKPGVEVGTPAIPAPTPSEIDQVKTIANDALNTAQQAMNYAEGEVDSARQYAESANLSMQGAASYYRMANDKAYQADRAAGNANGFALTAGNYAQTASQSASEASQSATNAASSASTATAKASEANTSATTASQAAQSASSSATAAENSYNSARDEASQAASSAATARGMALTAGNYMQAAAQSAAQAAGSATNASRAQTAAETAQGAAETAQGKAEAAQAAAETAQAAAEASAQSVSASAAQIAQNTSDISDLSRQLSDVEENQIPELKSALNEIIDIGTTFTTGHFINNNGIVSDSDVFAMSGEIKLANGQTITAYLKSFLNVEFSAIAVKNTDGTYTKKVGSKLTATWDEITYTATENCIVVLSTYSDSGDVSKATAYIYVNGAELQENIINYNNNIVETNRNTSDIGKLIDAGGNFTIGYFINNNGIVSDSNVFAMTGEIKLAKGQTITAYLKSFLNVQFAAIAVKNADGSYTKKVNSKLTETWDEYTYTATDDCIVVLSTYSDSGDISKATASIYVNGEDLQKELVNIHDNIVALGKYGLQTLSLSFISGKFINHNGAESSNENYKRTTDIPISKNQTIHFYAQGVSTVVSLIAKHNDDGTFTPLIVCTDATPVWSTYKATENCNVVISSNASLMVVAEEYYTKDFFDYVGEKVGEMPDGTNPLKDLRYDGGFTRIFDSIGCIGDSLASGETYSNEGGSLSVHSPNWPISWGDRIAKICNNTAVHLSRGGQTTKTWLEEWSSNTAFTDNACKAYIIALGANDSNGVNSMVLGNQSDADSVVVTPGTSFYGNYSQIIRDIKAIQPKAKIFVVTVPTSNAETKGFNTAIRYMATYYTDVYVIDLYTYGLDIYNAMTTNSGLWRASHGNSLSYMIIAWHLSTYIDWIINNNYSEFSQVEYIGTDWSWTDN